MKIRIKWKNVVIVLFFLIFLFLCVFSVVKIVKWKIDSNNTKKLIDNITTNTPVVEKKDSDSVELINEPVEKDETDPYWKYISMSLVEVDFKNLIKENSDTLGWIKVDGTNINYPFVQASDNEYYLTHSFDKSYSDAGWLFLDYRNNINELGRNNIIYGHGRYDTTMFGTLKNIMRSNWYYDNDNHIVKLSTLSENTLWQVFSVYRIKTTSDYIITEFSSDEEFEKFIDLIKNRSSYNFYTSVNTNDKILTLSTCYDNDDKIVMHAKLIKKETR